jgi:aryl-alcohol dehydrogenase-like predicted oxidoreductase
MVDLCFERGVNFFDTANVYTDGASETILGNVIKGRRKKAILASKVGNKTADLPDVPPLSKKAIFASLDASLKRLQTDYLDIYYLHLPDYEARIEDTLEAMAAVVRAGKVRYPATSNFASWQVAQTFQISERKGHRPPYVSQPMQPAGAWDRTGVPFCKQYGVSMSSSTRWRAGSHREAAAAARWHALRQQPVVSGPLLAPCLLRRRDQLAAVAEDRTTLIDFSLNWLLHHTATDCGFSAHRKSSNCLRILTLSSGPLSEEALAACDLSGAPRNNTEI